MSATFVDIRASAAMPLPADCLRAGCLVLVQPNPLTFGLTVSHGQERAEFEVVAHEQYDDTADRVRRWLTTRHLHDESPPNLSEQ